MDQETLNTLMSMVILPLLLALSGFAVAWLRKKTQEITANINDATVRKYVDLASDAAVSYTHLYALRLARSCSFMA